MSGKQWLLPLEGMSSPSWWWVDADMPGWSQHVLVLLWFASSLFSWMLVVKWMEVPIPLPHAWQQTSTMVATQRRQFSTGLPTSSYSTIPPSYVAMLAFSDFPASSAMRIYDTFSDTLTPPLCKVSFLL